MAGEKYDQGFFLDLAAKGKDAWNKWRRDRKDVRVTFAGVDFSQAPKDQINFEGFEFGDFADFSNCKWRGVRLLERSAGPDSFAPGRAFFKRAAFGRMASFKGAAFGDMASFKGAAFGYEARFKGAALMAVLKGVFFGYETSFAGAAFGDQASFDGAAFKELTRFDGAAFGVWASFEGAAFGQLARFNGAAFGQLARFNGAAFGYKTSFHGAAFGDWASFDAATFKGAADFSRCGWSEEEWAAFFKTKVFPQQDKQDPQAAEALETRHKELRAKYGCGPDKFWKISFANARFDGEAIFSGRSFEQIANFAGARFCSPPNFDGATNVHRIDLTGAHIGFAPRGKWFHFTTNSEIPIRLRALRKIAEETKNHDLERDLYIEERKAERGVHLRQRWQELKGKGWTAELKGEEFRDWPRKVARLIIHLPWIAVMGLYWALADYGRSFLRPFLWLIASGYGFYQLYLWILAPLMAKAPDMDKYKHAVGMLALGNTVPFVGPLTIDSEIKRFLFCPGCDAHTPAIPPEGYQLLVLSQNLLSILLVFFIGLALRNYFKIK